MYSDIDVSKGKSTVCMLDSNKKVIAEFEILHTKEGFEKLAEHLTPDTKIAMEVTSNYCKTLFNFLKKKYDVTYVDNSKLKSFIRLNNPYLKNDKADAKAIAEYLSFGFKNIQSVKVDELKDLCRLYHKTLKQLTVYKL